LFKSSEKFACSTIAGSAKSGSQGFVYVVLWSQNANRLSAAACRLLKSRRFPIRSPQIAVQFAAQLGLLTWLSLSLSLGSKSVACGSDQSLQFMPDLTLISADFSSGWLIVREFIFSVCISVSAITN